MSFWTRAIGDHDHALLMMASAQTGEAMATHSSTLAWKIPWPEGPGRLQSMGSQRVGTTKWLHFPFSLSCIGKENGNPLQCSCLENPRDGGAWRAAVYGVAQSPTWLKWLSSKPLLPTQTKWPQLSVLHGLVGVRIPEPEDTAYPPQCSHLPFPSVPSGWQRSPPGGAPASVRLEDAPALCPVPTPQTQHEGRVQPSTTLPPEGG